MIEEDQTNRLNADQKVLIKDLFSQGVKHKMKVNLGRQLSRPSGRERTVSTRISTLDNSSVSTQSPEVSSISVWTKQLSVTSRADFESSLAETEAEESSGLESEANKGNSDHKPQPPPSPTTPQNFSSVDRANRRPLDLTKLMILMNSGPVPRK